MYKKKFHFLFVLASLVSIISALTNCSKSSGGGGSNTEENLVVQTTPVANGHLEAPAPGPNFPLNVTITSKMPSSGVKIDVTAKPDGGTVPFYSTSVNTTSASNDFSITGSTAGIVNVVSVTVTSLTKSTNTWSGSYKYSRK